MHNPLLDLCCIIVTRWRGWCDIQSNVVNWYEVCKECCQCDSSVLSELTLLSVAGYNLNLLDEQLLRPFAKLPHQPELIHFMLTDILDKPLWLVSCVQFITHAQNMNVVVLDVCTLVLKS